MTNIFANLVPDVIKLIVDPLDRAVLAMTCKAEQAARPASPENIGMDAKNYLAIQAVLRGHVELAMWWLTDVYTQQRERLQAYEDPQHGYEVMMAAAKGGHADLVRFIHERQIMGESDGLATLGLSSMEDPCAIPALVWLELKIMGIRIGRPLEADPATEEKIRRHLVPTHSSSLLGDLLYSALVAGDFAFADDIWQYDPGFSSRLFHRLGGSLHSWGRIISRPDIPYVWCTRAIHMMAIHLRWENEATDWSKEEVQADSLLPVPDNLASNDEGQVFFFGQWLRRRGKPDVSAREIRRFCGRNDMNLWLVQNTALSQGWLTPTGLDTFSVDGR